MIPRNSDANRVGRIAATAALIFLAVAPAAMAATQGRTVDFNSGWRFARGSNPGAEAVEFNDTGWRVLDLPHDWSIEDLPPGQSSAGEILAVPGEWRFRAGDNEAWKQPGLDDGDWQKVSLPATWEFHSGYTADRVYGWFRRRIDVPAELKGRDFDLLLGSIDDVDEVWFNGERIGGLGSFPPEYETAYNVERCYRVDSSLVHGDGSDVVAVRVYDAEGDGGIYRAGRTSERIGPFDSREGASGFFTGYTVGGVGWYRKRFATTETDRNVAVLFDGVYMNAEVWINGHRLGLHPYGYTSFEYDLTPHLRPAGRENVLAVRVNSEGRNSRWYSGSGIYRPVWLVKTGPVHVPNGGVFVTTPHVSAEDALVKIEIEVRNGTRETARLKLCARVRDASGRETGAAENSLSLISGETRTVESFLAVPRPQLWSQEAPHLYSATVEIVDGDEVVDTVSTQFGVRSIEFSAEKGFLLNGEPVLLKGGCVHHDNGPLGAAAIGRAEERRIELLKANGFNAIRTSHNPPSSAFLDACDRLGVLVIEEAFDQWNEPKEGNLQDYHRFFEEWYSRDIASMVRRDRNHPSVIMWSVGNEIPEQFRPGDTGRRLRAAVLAHDGTRPVTQAICNDWAEVTRVWGELADPAFTHLDVAGYNYLPERYEEDHARHPGRVMYGAESYPKDAVEYWALAERHPYVIGDFVWAAIDYLGEAGIAHSLWSDEPDSFFMSWPWYNSWTGDLDLCGFKKPQSYFRDVVWRRSPIEMLVHEPFPHGQSEVVSRWGWPKEHKSWTWPGAEGKTLLVSVYSRCERVRLELNGRVIGEMPVSEATNLTAKFEVPYLPGELRAIGMQDGKVVAESELRTAGAPAALRLKVDRPVIRADRDDLAYVTVEVVDAVGQRVPNAALPVRFTVSGAGELAAQGSGVPNKPASFRTPVRETFEGRCLAILRPLGGSGRIELIAESEGLPPATVTISTQD